MINNHILETYGNGLVIQSSDPFVFNNRIEKNKENGIYSYSYQDKIRCDGKIKRNEIQANNENGIFVKGYNNRAIIEAN